MERFEIRPLTTFEELTQVEKLQETVWEEEVVRAHMLLSIARNGGLILGAVREGSVVAFLLSYLGLEDPDSDRPAMANLKLVSQRMAVLPELRNTGIGYELKMAQRQHAIRLGIRLITWTFDPLLSRNAHLNIRKLGAIIRDYLPNYYGTGDSPLVKLGSSDRVLVEWWVTNNRVEQRVSGKRSGLSIAQYINANASILNPAQVGEDGLLRPAAQIAQAENSVVLVEIPDNYEAIIQANPELAKSWRRHSRAALETTLAAGYMITDFVHGKHDGHMRSFYALIYGGEGSSDPRPPGRFSFN